MMKRWFFVLATASLALMPVAANAATEQVLYSFGDRPDGEQLYAGLISVKGTFYGTTFYGGQYGSQNGQYAGDGTVFSLYPATGKETVLWSFGNGTDGRNPYAGLVSVNGTLYGTTWFGGGHGNYGSVFSLDPNTGAEKVLWGFGGKPDGAHPYGGLISVKGKLYGTTMYGGAFGQSWGNGAVFSFDPATGKEKVVWSFQGGSDGQFPQAGLISVKGTLYGTTALGGCCGTVFSLDPDTGAEKVLWLFRGGAGGAYPWAGLTSVNGKLYGTTLYGGQYGDQDGGYGTMFSLDPRTGKERMLWSFGKGTDGRYPLAGLISMNGKLYGTTWYGGQYGGQDGGYGTMVSFDPTTGKEKVVWSFGNGTDGAAPYDGLISIKGTLYGTTWKGGQGGYGTAFSLTP